MDEFILIEAAADTDGNARPKVIGLAYSGGKMNLPGWKHPVVVELAGLTLPERVPLLTNHDNRTTARVGLVAASHKDNSLEIEGEIVSNTPEAADIVAQAKTGAAWQLSIGAEVHKFELVKASREVNGQVHEAPFYHIQSSTLREVSVVAVGADIRTELKVTASFHLTQNGEHMDNMNDNKPPKTDVTAQGTVVEQPPAETPKAPAAEAPAEQKPAAPVKAQAETVNQPPKEAPSAPAAPQVQAAAPATPDVTAIARDAAVTAVNAERDRVSAIQEICGGDYPEIEKEAIKAGWTPDVVSQKVLATIRAERPTTDVAIIVKNKPEGDDMRKTLEAAMCLRVGVPAEELSKSHGEKVVEAGMLEMDMPVKQLLIECMKLEGKPVTRSFDNSTIQAAFSTVSLPGILSNVANKKLMQSYQAQPIIATKLCSEGDLSDFKENDRYRLTDVGDLLPVAADGEIKEGGLVEESAKNQLETYGKKFCLTRKMIINDDLGSFFKVPTAMGNRAARLIDQLFFSRLLKNPNQLDGKALFSAAHRNLLTGAASAISPDALKKAIQLFLDQVDADGQPISVEPRYLVVPTALKHLAIELTQGSTLIMTGTDKAVWPSVNILANEHLQVVSSPYLANSGYDGASETGWYLFGDHRQVDTFEIGYLKGRRTPTVERGETDFNTLGLWFRVYFDVGVREQDHRGMVRANGHG